jgi:hypothetical protein
MVIGAASAASCTLDLFLLFGGKDRHGQERHRKHEQKQLIDSTL